MNDTVWIPAILVFVAAVLATLSIALLSELLSDWLRRRAVGKRLQPVLTGRAQRSEDGASDLVRDAERRGLLGAAASRVPGLGGLTALLEQSRVGWTTSTFLLATGGIGLSVCFTSLVLGASLLVAALVTAVAAATPYLYVSHRRKARFKQFEEEFPEAIDLLTRAIRAGHPLSAGMGMVADEGPPEVAAEFRRTFEEQRFGIPFDEALLGMVDRTDLVDVRIFVIAVLVQREVGGNLAEILENLAHTIRRRFYIRRQLRVYTAQGRMTGYALAALPVFVGIGIFLINPEYITLLFTHFVGRILIGTALVLQLLGTLWIRKIIRIDI